MEEYRPIRRALLSVSDKTGIVEFARELSQRGVELISTGGTAELLSRAGIRVIEVADYTNFPEMMEGRLKTLHPKIHGGILGRRGQDDQAMAQHAIAPIDMVVVNLYPFAQVVTQPDSSLSDAIENIDIGGPTMVRAAAKNHQDVAIIVDHHDYTAVIAQLDSHNNTLRLDTRFHLATKAFEHTAAYDSMIANHFGSLVPDYYGDKKQPSGRFPRTLNLQLIKKQDLRYGENSHQQGAFYIEHPLIRASMAGAEQLQGKTLSYNNIADGDAALGCVKQFTQPACVIVKHANPCGVALGDNLIDAYQRAYSADPVSAFGGIIAFNQELDADTALAIIQRQFAEVIIAPSMSHAALTHLRSKPNIRLLVCGSWLGVPSSLDFKRVNGGVLVQDRDLSMVTSDQLRVVTTRQPTEQELQDAFLGWKVAKFVKSNAIVYAKDNMTVGIGAGQMSRVYSTKLASMQANEQNFTLNGAVMASDAFFPFRDSIDLAAISGISCVIQPGGSLRDDEVISAANQHGIAMIFTGMRHFRH